MNTVQFNQAFELAKAKVELPEYRPADFGLDVDYGLFDGYAYPDFDPVTCTIKQVAALMRWQARYLNGNWDMEEINDIREVGRAKFMVVGDYVCPHCHHTVMV